MYKIQTGGEEVEDIEFPGILKEYRVEILGVNIEKQITDLLKQLNDSQVISDTEYKKLKPRGSRFGALYGLCKIHKSLIDN